MVGCTAREIHAPVSEIHAPASEIHMQERMVHALAHADWNEAQSRAPGS